MHLKSRGTVLIAWIGLLLAVTPGFIGCGAAQAESTSTVSAVTSTAATSSAATTVTVPQTTTTTGAYEVSTTSVALGIAAGAGVDAVRQLGDATISYLSGKGDLATVQAPVAPSAQDSLAQMLSLLSQPTRCRVEGMAAFGSSNEIQAELLFVEARREPALFTVTILVDPDKRTVTITAISPEPIDDPYAPTGTTVSTTVTTILDGTATGSSRPVIQVQAKPKIEYMSYPESYFTAQAVALAKVVEVLPLRRNPLAGTGDPDGPNEHQPIVYKGYVLEVEKAYGPTASPSGSPSTLWGMGPSSSTAVTYEVREEFPLDVSPGDSLFVPLVKAAYFGTPELKEDEYWVQANWAAFAVDDKGNCARVTGADLDPEFRSEFPLSFLEDAAVEQGKQPSLLE